jgi:DNA gyrase subunit A
MNGQASPDGSMEPLSPQESDDTDYGLLQGERIKHTDVQQEMRDSYLAYALSVIVERALPDVRDGMKPVHRRVIYAMYDGGYRPDRGYNKCSRVVGDVMGKYHPHGDSAIYDTLVRMAQSWSMRYMLVDGQGNFGSPGDDGAAAMRYTECRMAPLAMEMVRDIDKGHRRFRAELRWQDARADRAAGPLPEPAGQRLIRHCRGYGHQHPAA